MEIHPFNLSNAGPLFAYWRRLADHIPYFFPTAQAEWMACFLEDRLEGEKKFQSLETLLAWEGRRLIGFVQYGQPAFAWNSSGERYADPSVGVIRQLYFDQDRPDAGQALLDQALEFLTHYPERYAFYHILGMGCNAHHGKLPENQAHVHRLLAENGFTVQHQNFYYILDMLDFNGRLPDGLKTERIEVQEDLENWAVLSNGVEAAWAQLRYLNRLTGGETCETAYLTWIAVHENCRGQGLGEQLMCEIVGHLLEKGIKALHTDTIFENTGAQRFYERLGFRRWGITRSYQIA